MRDHIFSVSIDRVRCALDGVGVGREDIDIDSLETAFARVAWNTIAEPGDALAGGLVEALGPAGALAGLLQNDESLLRRALPEAPARSVADAVARWRPRLVAEEVLASLGRAARCGATLLVPDDVRWPDALDDLGAHAPVALWVRGRDEGLEALQRSVALVGSRASTAYGERTTIELASGLAARRFAIVSGAAYGIDGIAHRAALAGEGVTVAFLAGGVDRFYPAAHSELLRRIGETGAVISEVPCGTAPTRWRFLQRNRLIAAASNATVVVEAGSRSGSINTAGHAATLGRPLGAVPGSIESAASAGCHRLLREYDAVCVTSAEEAAELAAPGEASRPVPLRPGSDPLLVRVVDALGDRALPTERIAQRAGVSPSDAEGALLLLELGGSVVGSSTGWRRA